MPPPLIRGNAVRIRNGNAVPFYNFNPRAATISTNAAPHMGTRSINANTNNIGFDITNGTEMVELHANPGHLFTKEGINGWIASKGNAVTNPLTRASITQQNIKRYTATKGGKRRSNRKTRRSNRKTRRSKRKTRRN
jgi:hypothetical protein